jgi:hypothetical protein
VQVRERRPVEALHDQPFEKRPHPPRVEELDVHEWRENVVAWQRLAVYVEAQRQPPIRVSSRVPVADPCPGVQVDAGWKVGHFVGDRACVAQGSLQGGSIRTGMMSTYTRNSCVSSLTPRSMRKVAI